MAREAAGTADLESDDDLDELVSEGLGQAEREAERRTGETIVDDDTGTGADTSGTSTTDDEDAGSGDGADDLAKQLDDETDAGEGGEAEPITREEDGAQWNDKAGRWQKDGKFVEGAAPEAATAAGKKAATDAAAGGTSAATTEKPAASAAAPKWEPFGVTVDRQTVAIPDASLQKAGGFTFVGVPDAKWPDFQRYIVRGIAAQRMWRGLQQEREALEQERSEEKGRPKLRTDSEVEADILNEVLKPHLGDLLDEKDLQILELRIKDAQRAEKDKLGEWESKRGQASTAAREEETTQSNGLAETLVEIAERPEFKALTDEDLREVLHTYLMPVRRSLYYKEGDAWFRNTEYVYDRLKDRLDAKVRGTATTETPAKTDATPPKGGTTAATGKGTDRADQLNRGHETAARPQTTNLKAGRGKGGTGTPTRPSTEHHRDAEPKDTRTKAQKEEDEFRKTKRGYLNSDSLDFDEEE